MNLLAMIGVVENIKKGEEISTLTLKVEKPFMENKKADDYFDNIDVQINSLLFAQDLAIMDIGNLISLKGRVKNIENNLQIIAENIQIF
ncbi:MAG: hypothetical protein HUJ42_00750 [Malacoplasma sp.]|nr:hypothetical protein [Malacoplasma sp.]